MAESPSKEQMFSFLFMNLVMNFQMAAMQQMGKLKNPVTDKIERDLQQARMSIDLLEMLKAKTAGNLTQDEEKMLGRIISELQLNYVDEVSKDKDGSTQDKEKTKETTAKDAGKEDKEIKDKKE